MASREADAEQGSVRCDVGDSLVVGLTDAGTTGLDWSFAASGDGGLAFRSRTLESAAGVGARGKLMLSFEAERAGLVLLRFELREPWGDPAEEPDDTHVLRVEIDAAERPTP